MTSTKEEEAIAVLISVDIEKGEPSWDIFRESDLSSEGKTFTEDPTTRAWRLHDACKDDFPATRFWSVSANSRAQTLRGEFLVKLLMGDDDRS